MVSFSTNKDKEDYNGWELESFDEASNFRELQLNKIKKFIKNKDIIDIGSGNGGLINYYLKETNKVSAIEPSVKLKKVLEAKYKKKINIFLNKKRLKKKYDVILYMDVIEHIKKYNKEIELIKNNLKKDGLIIINVPAFNFLYTDFDKNIGHIKRFSKKDILNISKKHNLKIEKIEYYDSIGFFLILFTKFFFKIKLNKRNVKNNIKIWDSLIPISKFFDRIFLNLIGKSLICVLKNKQ